MKKNIIIFIVLIVSVLNLNAKSLSDDAFNEWVSENSKSIQTFGLGYNEGGLGITYGVNVSPVLFDTKKSNFYTFIEISNNRLEFLEGYDLLRNYGLDGVQFIPSLGMSIDTSSAKMGFLYSTKLRYNFYDNYAISIGQRYFFYKPTTDSGDNSKDKNYLFGFIEYQF